MASDGPSTTWRKFPPRCSSSPEIPARSLRSRLWVKTRAISTIALCALIVLVTWLGIGWIGPSTSRAALRVGSVWLVLTLAFEFLAGHYLFHKSWAALLDDYDVGRGRIWVLVLVTTVLAPVWLARTRGLVVPRDRRA